jgi:hypothetical protein
MNDDDRLSRYLAEQAGTITLAPGDPADAARRGARRRNRRRGAIVAVAAVAVGASSFSVIDRGEPDTKVESDLAAAVVASPFDWTVVAPEVGLGYSRSMALVDGAVYSLSTEPGPYDDDGSYEPTLYRSDDGADWAEVSLPAGVRPSSLGSAGDTLYAIGTAPAGGDGRGLVLAASTDGAASWSSVTLPADIAALEARHPGQITLSQPAVAATDATHLVVSVVVSAAPDIAALLPGEVDPNAGWEMSSEGVTLYELVPCEGEGSGECSVYSSTTAVDPEAETTELDGGADASGRRVGEAEPMQPKVKGFYAWDELGLDPELQALIGGQTYVYATDDGSTFEPATLPDGARGWGGQLMATDDGYRLYVGQADPSSSSTQVLRSADGHTWTTATTLPGSPQSAGLLGGRPALGLWGAEGLLVQVEQGDGSYVVLDLLSAVDGADGTAGVADLAFGPLGLAALVWADDSGNSSHIVHSVDGTSLSSVDVRDHLSGPGIPIGISVSADAVLVRVDGPSDGDPSTVPTQQVLVGTPR